MPVEAESESRTPRKSVVVEAGAFRAALAKRLGATFVRVGDNKTKQNGQPVRKFGKITHFKIRNALRGDIDAALADVHAITLIDAESVKMLKVIDRTLSNARRSNSQANIEKMVAILAEAHDPLASINAEIDAANAAARIRFVETFRCLTSEDVTTASGSTARNRSQTASRWKAEGKVFSMPWRGQEIYPAFQFKDGRPRKVIAGVLAALPAAMSPWERAFWFVSTNGWLDGASPADRLDQPEAVIAAARNDAEAVAG